MKSQDLVIIGGASGMIGSAIVKGYAESDCHVFALDVKPLQLKHKKIQFLKVDLSSESAVKKAFQSIFKGQKIQNCTLINCQGIADPETGPIEDLSVKVWQRYFDTNILSYFLCCRSFVAAKKSFSTGSIINISSTRHIMAEANTEAYCATKGAIASFSKALAISCGKVKIRVNTISPGWISESDDLSKKDHQQHPSGRVGRPEDIFSACRFLSSPGAEFITGQDIVVDGGMTAKMIYI